MVQESDTTSSNQTPPTSAGTVRCALTGKEISADEAYWAPPLVTTGELVRTLASTLFRNPANLSNVLFGEQPDVPYAPEAREELASRRTSEQVKLLLLLLLIVAVIVVPIYLLVQG
jgi:hypothetical protein